MIQFYWIMMIYIIVPKMIENWTNLFERSFYIKTNCEFNFFHSYGVLGFWGSDAEDYAYKEWGAKRRKKRQHSLSVAVTWSQKWGAQTKADPSQRQAEHALKPRNAEESSGNDATSAPETEQPYYTSRSQRTVPISEGSEMRWVQPNVHAEAKHAWTIPNHRLTTGQLPAHQGYSMPATPRLLDDQCQQQHNMLTEFQSFYVEDLEQFLLNAEQALHRELQAARMELHYHQVQHRTDL